MSNKKRVIEVIYAAVDEVNKQLSREMRLEKSSDSVILGSEGKLDSLGFVNFIVAAEAKIEEELGATVRLVDENTISEGYFSDIGALADYISSLLEGKENVQRKI